MKILTGRTAFVTGGASGIGLGIAQELLDAGMNVMIADILPERVEEALAGLAAYGERVDGITLDVSDRDAMAAAADAVERRFGKIHVVCNNAGVGRRPEATNVDYADWDWVVSVNIMGVVNGVMSFLPKLRAHGEGGHIVNTSSMAGLIPVPGMGGVVYCTSKFAVRGFSDSLRLTLAPERIGVSVLCPGLVRSNIMRCEEARPERLRIPDADKSVDETAPSASNAGMDPREVGALVREAILNNHAYILPHGEHEEEVAALFQEILDAFPGPQEIDPGRLAAEEDRRAQTAAARAAVARLTAEG